MKGRIEYYFGIDFGTTNSAAVAIKKYKDSVSYINLSDDYGNPFPSLLAIDKNNGKVYCGRKVWQERRTLQDTCEIITSIKSYLDDENKIWKINNKLWTPKNLTTELFKAIKHHIEERIHEDVKVKNAVISIPVGFSSKKRKIIREAAKDAGIKVSNFISESTAVVFKNYRNLSKYRNIAVFDWGGGTLDISIVENINGKIKELSIEGEKIGGDDIDLEIARWIHKKIMKSKRGSLRFEDMSPKDQDKMIVVCERAKKELGENDLTSISITNYGEYGYVKIPLDIDEFTLILEKFIDKSIKCLKNAISNSGLGTHELDCIVMVGGSSYLVPLQDEIEELFEDINIEYPQDAAWNVAKGATLLGLNPGEIKLNQDIGLVLSDESFFPILNKHDSIEGNKNFVFGIVEDTNKARFVFTDSKKTIGYKNVPTYGFFQESIECNSKIDDNLIFCMDIKSKNMTEEYKTEFRYDKLKFYYDISKIDDSIYKQLDEGKDEGLSYV